LNISTNPASRKTSQMICTILGFSYVIFGMETNYRQLAKITDPENLRQAFKRVQAKKSSGGFDRETVADFSCRADTELERLREELLAGTYAPCPLLEIQIPKSNKPGEKRPLGLPSIRDKIAQDATRKIIEPLVDRHFLDNSYGYRFGKGPQKAVKRVYHIIKYEKLEWALILDVDDFFPSIDHDILLDILRSFGVEEPVCRLLLLWLKMGVINTQGKWRDVYHGISQGGIISPLLANIYLHTLDVFLKENNISFVRYADDIRLFHSSRRTAEENLTRVQQFLQEELKLKLNSQVNAIMPVEKGFPFMGIFFTRDKLTIDQEKWESIQQKLRKLFLDGKRIGWTLLLKKLNESIRGWKNYYGELVESTEMERLREEIKGHLGQCIGEELFRRKKENPGIEQELKNSFEFLELPACTVSEERSALIIDLFQKARDYAQNLSEKNQTNRTVTKTVRKEKRHHFKQASHVAHLVINTPGYFLGKNGERLIVREKKKILYEVFINRLESITLLTQANSLSSDVITRCAKQGIPLCWISSKGEVEALVIHPGSPNTELQLHQLEASLDPQQTFVIAKSLVTGKIKNQINLIKYFGKYEKNHNKPFLEAYPQFDTAIQNLLNEIGHLVPTESWAHTRGILFSIEGRLASHYWDMVRLLLEDTVEFQKRERQGAKDLVNCLLNYGYAILRSRVLLEIYRAGLNPYIGFLHAAQKGVATLSLDMMEIFRPQVVDRVVLVELRRRLQSCQQENDGSLSLETRQFLAKQIFARLGTIEQFRGKELKLEEIIREQVKDLRRHIEKKTLYRPYLGKW
jgi:group II intron reverse transcriptase/maturase/CRISPR-associated endonuclease Cas1